MANGSVWSTPLDLAEAPQQVFVGSAMGFEARWPDATLGSLLSHSSWAPTGKGSRYGHIVSQALAQTGIDWTGALATLQVAHQFYTWTRDVQNHTAGSDTFYYAKNLPGITYYANVTTPWEKNMFFLSGKLEALDSPGEWFFDVEAKRLYVWPHDSQPPGGRVSVKNRTVCVSAGADNGSSTADDVAVAGLQLFGCTLRLYSNRASVSYVDLLYPTYDKRIREMDVPKGAVVKTIVSGNYSTVANVTVAHSNNGGLYLDGFASTLTNSLVNDTDWLGTLTYSPLGIGGQNNSVSRSTVSYFGNAGVVHHAPNTEVSYTHIHHGGLIGLDHAGLYTGGWNAAGTHWHHLFVHDCLEKCLRGDDQSRNMTIHNVVAWNCGQPQDDRNNAGYGLVLKGNGHVVYANTFFNASTAEVAMPNCGEPYKPWAHQWPLDPHQNNRSQVFNDAIPVSTGKPSCRGKGPFPTGGHQQAVFNGSLIAMMLKDPASWDFTPLPGSPLVDAGVVYPPFTDGHVGPKPDIGAYELGGEQWTAGCTMPGC